MAIIRKYICSIAVLGGLVALGLFVGGAGQANADYIFTTIDVPGATFTTVGGINNVGQIVGSSSAGSFLLSGGNYTRLNFPAVGINDSGDILGGNAILHSDGSVTTLSVPSRGVTISRGINNSGQVVGSYYDEVKTHAFLYSRGSFSIIGPPNVTNDIATGINNVGQIIGAYGLGLAGGWLRSGGTYSDLPNGLPQPPLPTGINDSSQIVGWVADFDPVSGLHPKHSFLLSDGVYTTLDVPGATMTEANGINNAGEIVGTYVDAGGVQHGFLATPTPEPSTLLLLGMATLSFIGWTWRPKGRASPLNAP